MTDVMPILNKELINKIDEDAKTSNANEKTDEIVLEKEVEPREQDDMFKDEIKMEVKKVKKKVDDILDISAVEEEEDEDKPKPKKKRTYPHLEKARAKALLNRQKRAEEKRIEKEKKAEEKKELKLEKARLRIEKKKENARNHYWEKKAENQKLGIVETKPTPQSNISNYDDFASMMDRYNSEKMTQYKAQQKLKQAEEHKKEGEKRKKKLSNPLIHRPNIRGMYVSNPDYPNDFFF